MPRKSESVENRLNSLPKEPPTQISVIGLNRATSYWIVPAVQALSVSMTLWNNR